MWKRIWKQWEILPSVWNAKETRTGTYVVQFHRREIRYRALLWKGIFRYETIVHFLLEYHGISINVRRLRQCELPRRNQVHSGPVYTGPDKFLHGQKLARFHLPFTRDRRNWTNFWTAKCARIRVNTTAICNRIYMDPCKQAVREQNSSVQKFVRTRVNGA